jgi:hypothetical protein
VERAAHGPRLDERAVDVDGGPHGALGQPADARGEREARGRSDLRLRPAHRAAHADERAAGARRSESLRLEALRERVLVGPRPRRTHQVSPPPGGGHEPIMRRSSAIWPTW